MVRAGAGDGRHAAFGERDPQPPLGVRAPQRRGEHDPAQVVQPLQRGGDRLVLRVVGAARHLVRLAGEAEHLGVQRRLGGDRPGLDGPQAQARTGHRLTGDGLGGHGGQAARIRVERLVHGGGQERERHRGPRGEHRCGQLVDDLGGGPDRHVDGAAGQGQRADQVPGGPERRHDHGDPAERIGRPEAADLGDEGGGMSLGSGHTAMVHHGSDTAAHPSPTARAAARPHRAASTGTDGWSCRCAITASTTRNGRSSAGSSASRSGRHRATSSR